MTGPLAAESTATAAEADTIRALKHAGRIRLEEHGIANAAQEVSWLMQAALGCSEPVLHLEGSRALTREESACVCDLFRRRARREPLQYLLGSEHFCGREFVVTRAVLIPRPETELLVQQAIARSQTRSHPIIADVGTGSGCIAVSLAASLASASCYATDLSPAALAVARLNAERLGVADRIQFLDGDLLAPLLAHRPTPRFTLLISNPPYVSEAEMAALQPEVEYEPALALAGGADGMAVLQRLLQEAPALLVPGGWLVLEVGQGQAERMLAAAARSGFYGESEMLADHAGIPRVVSLRRNGVSQDR
jgi:release factor glutamine methyltransferase